MIQMISSKLSFFPFSVSICSLGDYITFSQSNVENIYCFSDRRPKRPVPSIGWNQRHLQGPIHRAVYTVNTMSSPLIFLLNISCPCPMTKVTQPLSTHPWPTVTAVWAVIMASLDYYVVLKGNGSGNYRIIKWQGKYSHFFFNHTWAGFFGRGSQ